MICLHYEFELLLYNKQSNSILLAALSLQYLVPIYILKIGSAYATMISVKTDYP